jgi:hypothetical protein
MCARLEWKQAQAYNFFVQLEGSHQTKKRLFSFRYNRRIKFIYHHMHESLLSFRFIFHVSVFAACLPNKIELRSMIWDINTTFFFNIKMIAKSQNNDDQMDWRKQKKLHIF